MPASTSSKIRSPGPSARAAKLGADDGDGERDARELAARGDLGERARRRSGVAGDMELGRLDAERLRRIGRDELDREAAAGHAELLHRPRHRGGELRRRRAPRRGDPPRLGIVGSARGIARALERIEVGGGVELAQLGLPLGEQRRQVGGRPAMAPRQRHPCRQPLLDLAQARRVELGAVEVAGERVRRVLKLRLRALQRFDRTFEARIERGDVLQRVDRAAGERIGAGVGFGDRIEREPRRVEQRLAVREAGVLGVELGPLVGAGSELGDFADLPGEPLALALEIALLLARRGERLRRRAPRRPVRGERRGVDLRIAVEQRAHRRRASEPLPRVLAVDVDEVLGRFAQLRDRRAAAVDPGAALSLRVDRPAQQHAAGIAGVGVEAGVGEPGRERGRDVELGADLGARRSLADDAGVTAAAERELQRLDQDRLARAGLAAQHRQAAGRSRSRANRR